MAHCEFFFLNCFHISKLMRIKIKHIWRCSISISYQILCPKLIQGITDPKKCTDVILQQTGLTEETFRLGLTKAGFQFYLFISNCAAAANKFFFHTIIARSRFVTTFFCEQLFLRVVAIYIYINKTALNAISSSKGLAFSPFNKIITCVAFEWQLQQ